MRYQSSHKPYFLVSGTPTGVKSAHKKGLVRQGVPRVIEDFKPLGNPNGRRQDFQEYLVQLMNVKDGGTIDMPGGNSIRFPPATPQLISTNQTFDDWIVGFKTFPDKIQNAIFKRIVFFTVPDSSLVKPELRKRKKEDMHAMVEDGLIREREFLKRHCPIADQLTVSTTASTVGESMGSTSDFEPFEGGDAVPVTPPVACARAPLPHYHGAIAIM